MNILGVDIGGTKVAAGLVDRKGENLDLFDELRAQGFVRVRVDGKVCDIDNVPKLSKTRKHTVEIVVDRVKVRADVKQRVTESFETALRSCPCHCGQSNGPGFF